MESEDLVSVYTVQSAAEAEIIRSALEAVGITCMIGGESQAGLSGVLEIDILTSAEDADRARKELKVLRHEKHERKKAQIEKKKARAHDHATEEEDPPQASSTDIQKLDE